MRLSTSTVQLSALSVEQACQRISELGFEAVDFWPANFGCPHLDEIEKRMGPRGLKELLAKHNLKLYAWYVNPFMHGHPAPDVMARALGTSRDYLKTCYAKTVAAVKA